MSWSLEWAADPWAVMAAAAVAVGLAWHLRRGRPPWPLAALRVLAAMGLVLAMLKPTLALREAVYKKPRVAILVDTGPSMRGPAGRKTRLEAAKDWLTRHRAAIEARAEPVLFAASSRGRKLAGFSELGGLKAASAGFQPAAAFRDAAEDAPPAFARAWLLSDGRAEGSSDSALGVPVDVLAVGPEKRGRRLSLAELRAPDFAFLHGRFQVQVRLEASELPGRRLRLKLSKEDRAAPGTWRPVAEKTEAILSAFETVGSTLAAEAAHLGAERYRLEASAEGAAPVAREFRVEVIRQKYRIMYLAGRPSPEYAQLREFLKSDPNHELVSFVILRNPENAAAVSDSELSLIPFPAEEIFVQNLGQFDLFILENFSYRRFQLPTAYLESLKRFVAAGGALLVIGGENAFGLGGYKGTPVEDLLPVTLTEQSPDFQNGLFNARPAAADHPLTRLYETAEASKFAWEALPPLDGFARFASVRPGSTVLAVHPKEKTAKGEPLPVFAIREHGLGKVMLVSSDSTWRWRLGGGADWRIATFYARFWSRAVQYLTGNLELSKVKFAPLPDRLPPREPAAFQLRVFDESFRPADRAAVEVTASWTGPDGRIREVEAREAEPGIYAIELTGLEPGAHRLRASATYKNRPWGEDQVRFTWEEPEAETPVDRAWLKGLADATGGSYLELSGSGPEALLANLPEPQAEAETRRRSYPWASMPWLLAVMFLFALEWAWRRWQGLP